MRKVFIIDDHPLVEDGIRSMLRDEPSVEIIAVCKSAGEALTFLEREQADLILLDINLPDMDGLTLCEKIRQSNQQVKIIGLTSVNEAGIITGFLQRGGNGYLLKSMDRQELLNAIEKVMAGKIHLSEAANENVLRQYQQINAAENLSVLTRREKQILHLLAEGMNGPEIAEKLFLSPLTIETHRKNLFRKFDVHSIQSLLKKAREQKLI
ncbi:MAG TPA: response regulator transcription factor [Cyclobacteriaceae bacterium]|nr:response regulator transcription factor [Cyclobacteriaceae bacterium]